MAREDLNPIEEARACALLVDELGLTREDVGRRVGRSRVAVSNLMRLLDLPDEVLELLAAGQLTEGHGRALLTAHDHDDRRRLARAGGRRRAGPCARPRPGRATPAAAHAAPRRTTRRAATPIRSGRPAAAGRARRRRSAPTSRVTPRGDGYRVGSRLP